VSGRSGVARLIVGAAVAALLAGCASATNAPLSAVPTVGLTSTPAPTPTPTPTPKPTPAPVPPQLVVAGPITLEAPADWNVRRGLINPSGNETLAYLGPTALPSECEQNAQGGVCQAWPIMELGPGGIVVAVREYGMPGSKPPEGGDPVTVGGIAARRISGPADEGCRAVGGSESIEIVLPVVPGTNWMTVDACLAGMDTTAAKASFHTIVSSIEVTQAGASPSAP
jgi:hypothetical protein